MANLLRASISVLTEPLVLALLMGLAAAVCHRVGRQRTGRVLLVCAGTVAYLASIPLVGQALLRPLESRFPPLAADRAPAAGYVVVLGSGYAPHDGIPVTATLDADGLERVVEAVRLTRALGARLVVSGGAPAGRAAPADGYAQLAQALGIPAETIIVCDRGQDTAAEARDLHALLGSAPFLLVTSAYHMPRAMLILRRAGANPIAAPTGQRAFGAMRIAWRAFVPGSGGLRDTELAVHEYLGLAALALGAN